MDNGDRMRIHAFGAAEAEAALAMDEVPSAR